MALVKGICKNFGECDLADNKEVQEVEKSNFVCEECGKPLHPIEKSGKTVSTGSGKKKLIIAIVAGILGLGIIGGIIYAFTGGDDSKEGKEPEASEKVLTLNHYEKELSVGGSDTLVAMIKPEGTEATLLWKASKTGILEVKDGIVKAIKAGEGKVRLQAIIGADTLQAICKYIVKEDSVKTVKEDSVDVKSKKDKPEPIQPELPVGPISLGWGTYDGPRSGRTPHGFGGSITVKSRHTIDLKKATGETVEVAPGDKIMNVKMDNGRLRQGEIHFSDGRRKFISGL